MLNAFQHRNSHTQPRRERPPATDWCSTPFGIIGILTRLGQRESRLILVLNAFRHHRNSHLFPRVLILSP